VLEKRPKSRLPLHKPRPTDPRPCKFHLRSARHASRTEGDGPTAGRDEDGDVGRLSSLDSKLGRKYPGCKRDFRLARPACPARGVTCNVPPHSMVSTAGERCKKCRHLSAIPRVLAPVVILLV
jgi:hypothetical protein